YLVNRITILLGGRAAEEIVLHQQTTGAGDDLEKATEMARKMVCEWGMSERLGPLTFGKNEEHIFLGREVARAKDYSEDTALLIDSEIKRIVMDCASRAKQILEENIEKLHALARALLERESLDGEEIARILRARPFQEAGATGAGDRAPGAQGVRAAVGRHTAPRAGSRGARRRRTGDQRRLGSARPRGRAAHRRARRERDPHGVPRRRFPGRGPGRGREGVAGRGSRARAGGRDPGGPDRPRPGHRLLQERSDRLGRVGC